jgi:NAD(P)-dependent dehydrogenase (short-subunit alcohol dehydrogenase family)
VDATKRRARETLAVHILERRTASGEPQLGLLAAHHRFGNWRALKAEHMAQPFAVNAIGPGPLMKHLPSLLSRPGMSAFAALSARGGSIGDCRSGGWCSYRASKAALNQPVRTAALELVGQPRARRT